MYKKGSITVEMSFIMPIILLLFMSCIFVFFFFHDKAVVSGAAYETAVVGSTKMRQKEQVDEVQLNSLFQDRVDGKCIFFETCHTSISIGKEEVTVKVSAQNKGLRIFVEKKAAVTDPENQIRKSRRIKELINGT